MLFTTYLICAVAGGTVFVFQFVTSLVGLGAEDLDFGDALPDDVIDAQGDVLDHGSTSLFGVISFRTIVAALTFFGLFGMLMLQMEQSDMVALIVAIISGLGAMYGVHYLMQMLTKLRHDGTARIGRCVGQVGSVYVPIPGENSGAGKVQLRTQGRIMEYQAMTAESEKLATGTQVKVVRIVSPTTVEVETLKESVETENV